MKAYNIAATSNIDSLIKEVNLRADEGWEPFGNVFFENDYGFLCQCMTKEVQEGLTATDTYNSWAEDNIENTSNENAKDETGETTDTGFINFFRTGLDDMNEEDLDDERLKDS